MKLMQLLKTFPRDMKRDSERWQYKEHKFKVAVTTIQTAK